MLLKNILLIILILVIGLMFFCLLCFIQRGWNESPIREDQKFHIQTKTTRKRRSDDLSH